MTVKKNNNTYRLTLIQEEVKRKQLEIDNLKREEEELRRKAKQEEIAALTEEQMPLAQAILPHLKHKHAPGAAYHHCLKCKLEEMIEDERITARIDVELHEV
jgi:molecular chaperone GrpE (heat shock protein)